MTVSIVGAAEAGTPRAPEGATPQKALTELLADTGMRERMLDGEFTRIGVGTATAADGTVHVVMDFDRR